MDNVAGKSTDYSDRVRNELDHNRDTSRRAEETGSDRLLPTIAAFDYAMEIYAGYVRTNVPNVNFDEYVIRRSRSKPHKVRLASLGCGTGDWEVSLAQKAEGQVEVRLLDIDENLLEKASRVASREGTTVETEDCDINTMDLNEAEFDFIVCRSSLHHFLELEHVFNEIRKGLKPDGELIIIGEWVGRNGLQLFPETEEFAQKIFERLPERLRLNRYTNQIDATVPNINQAENSFEAIRSEDILPLLLEHFEPKEHVVFDAMVSLLFDFRYGPNYDLSRDEDKSIVGIITETDVHLVKEKILKPTALCGLFTPR